MIRIGLTGGIATGKTTATMFLQEYGCSVISSDEICAKLIKNDKQLQADLKKTFNCVDSDGNLNKKLLGNLIFNNQEAKKKLEDLIHPLVSIVRKAFFKKCEECGTQFAVCETPLLFEKNLLSEFDYNILLISSLEIRIERYILSGKGDQDRFFSITKNQYLDEIKKNQADFVIKNNGSKLQLKQNLEATLQEILKKHQKAMFYD